MTTSVRRPKARQVRIAASACVAFVALYLAAYFVLQDTTTRIRVAAVLFVLPMGAAAICTWLARNRFQGLQRVTWTLLSWSCISFFAAWAYREFNVFTQGRYPRPGSFEDLGILVGFALLLSATITLTGGITLKGSRRCEHCSMSWR